MCHALELMDTEGITSVAVIDNQSNVVGNISVADVKVSIHSDAGSIPANNPKLRPYNK